MTQPLWYCPHCQATGAEPGVELCPADGTRVLPIAERGAEWLGKVLDGKYKIVRFIDAGGTAEVYEAERTTTGKRVALKLLHTALASKPEMMGTFQQEAQLASLVAHPNVVAIQDFGTLSGAHHYMVMELLDGRALSVELAAGPLPVLTALRYAMQVCEGLAAAHARDVVHCDVKPSNIFLQTVPGQAEATVKILDLGIGRLFARGAAADDAHGAGGATPEYMSPEQALGKPVGPASDIYSMGVTLYEMLLGEMPFSGAAYGKLLYQHVHEPPPWPEAIAAARGVPPGTREVLWRALAKDPAERHGSMLELQRDLAGLGRHERAKASRRTSSATAVRAVSDQEPPPSGRPRVAPSARSLSKPAIIILAALEDAAGKDHELVALAPDVYWVGRRHGRPRECNPFLRVWRASSGQEMSMLVDPGPPRDLDVVAQKVATVLGSLKRLDYVFLSHPDLDAASNAAAILQASPRTRVIASEDTLRLMHFDGLDETRIVAVEGLQRGSTTLGTGHEVVFVRAPFCAARGSVMLYDRASRVLFSGDLFAGIRERELVASDESWPGVQTFHETYMPGRRALATALARIAQLDPPPLLLAPHHGAMIVGAEVALMLARIERLEVGLDLLEAQGGDEEMEPATGTPRKSDLAPVPEESSADAK